MGFCKIMLLSSLVHLSYHIIFNHQDMLLVIYPSTFHCATIKKLGKGLGTRIRCVFPPLGDDEATAISTLLVTVDDPRVVEAVDTAAEKASNSPIEITQEMYMEALKSGISAAEMKRREADPHGAQ